MRLTVRSAHVWIAVGLAALFWVTVLFIPNRIVLLLTNSLLLASSTAVGIAYMPAAWAAIRKPDGRRLERILLGIAYSWFFSGLWRIWSLFWITSGQPPELVNNDIIAFFQAGVCLGAIYHLTAPGAIGGGSGEAHPSWKWIAVGVVVGLASGLAGLMTLFEPDTSQLAAKIIPYLPR